MITDRSLELYKKAIKEVPGYKKYLKSVSFNPNSVKTIEDFYNIPLSSKQDYLQKFKHDDLVWTSEWEGLISFCATSGSTGEPYYFPRNEQLAEQASYMAEMFLRNSTYGKGRTLVLMAFGMGVWIGGIFTLRAFEIAASRAKLPVSILPTGYNKTEIFKALKKLAPEFDQVVIAGYPPFVKEVIDEASGEGINLKKLNVRLMFAAEAFTERFRKYVCEKAGVQNPLFDTLNIYGTADIGAMAYETPLSILIRRIALDDPLLLKDLFGQIEKTPTLAQYNSDFIEFEEVDGKVILTGNNALPLIRYDVGDHGGVLEYKDIQKLFQRYNIDLETEIKNANVELDLKKQPFVFVYERVNMAVTLHGMIIYPEFVKEALLKRDLAPFFSERFTMSTKYDIYHNQFIQINLELKKDVKSTKALEAKALKAIRASLIEKSSEFAEVSKSKASQELLEVVLWPNGHPRYFPQGVKQKWAEKVPV